MEIGVFGMSINPFYPKASRAQINYIDALRIDCQFNQDQFRAKLMADFKVEHTDELTVREASRLINELIDYKKNYKLPL